MSADGTKVYENYKSGVPKCRTALESFLSLLETKVYWENPIKYEEVKKYKEMGFIDLYEIKKKAFQNLESRTFDKARTIVLVKER